MALIQGMNYKCKNRINVRSMYLERAPGLFLVKLCACVCVYVCVWGRGGRGKVDQSLSRLCLLVVTPRWCFATLQIPTKVKKSHSCGVVQSPVMFLFL